MLFNLLNQKDNAVVNANRKLAEFLMVQTGDTVTMVDGVASRYTPNRPYYSESVSGDVLEALNQLNTLGKIVTPELETALIESGIKNTQLNMPSPRWSPEETQIRKHSENIAGGAKPTSSALKTILYDPSANIVHYNFREGNKTYHSFMTNSQFNSWITAPSIGKWWNRYLRTPGTGPLPRHHNGVEITSFKLPSAGEPTEGDVPNVNSPSTSSNTYSTATRTPQGNSQNPPLLGAYSSWMILRSLIKKMMK